MKNLYESFSNDRITLEHLCEEAGEIIQAKSKIIRFGMKDKYPENGKSNQDKLNEEIGHFLAVIDILLERKILDKDKISLAKEHKVKSMITWNAYTGSKKELD